jgi:hypothetical protein
VIDAEAYREFGRAARLARPESGQTIAPAVTHAQAHTDAHPDGQSDGPAPGLTTHLGRDAAGLP